MFALNCNSTKCLGLSIATTAYLLMTSSLHCRPMYRISVFLLHWLKYSWKWALRFYNLYKTTRSRFRAGRTNTRLVQSDFLDKLQKSVNSNVGLDIISRPNTFDSIQLTELSSLHRLNNLFVCIHRMGSQHSNLFAIYMSTVPVRCWRPAI